MVADTLPPVATHPPPPQTGKRVEENRTLAMDMTQLDLLAVPPHVRPDGSLPISEMLRSALSSLAANRMRTLLTMLGIIIGTSAVVALLAIGSAFSGFISDVQASNGIALVAVSGVDQRVNGVVTGNRDATLTVADAYALADVAATSENFSAVSPVVQRTATTVIADTANATATLVGVWPEFAYVNNFTLAHGEFIGNADVTSESRVVVLGATIARTLFGDENPVGAAVRVNGESLRVIGAIAPKGGDLSFDDQIFVPLSTAQSKLLGRQLSGSRTNGSKIVDGITLRARTTDAVDATAAEITEVLIARHHITDDTPDFRVSVNTTVRNTSKLILAAIQVFLLFVAGIALLIGGIGVMNIMLVSVTERTREIGIRKGIGAKESDILMQFLVEALLISSIGGGIGVAIGSSIGLLVNIVWRPATISPASILVAMGAALTTGLLFGVTPARRAARLKPIEALRAE